MKRIFLFALLTLSITVAQADKYKILYINYPQLWIDGKPAKVGDVFSDQSVIRWSKERQAMKAFNIDKNKQVIMVARNLDPKGISVKEILTANRHLSTHRGMADANHQPTFYDQIEGLFESHYDLMDPIFIKTDIELSPTRYFQVSYYYGDTRITKSLRSTPDNEVVIDKNIFNIDGKQLEARDIQLAIDFIDESTHNTIFVKDGIDVFVVPDEILD